MTGAIKCAFCIKAFVDDPDLEGDGDGLTKWAQLKVHLIEDHGLAGQLIDFDPEAIDAFDG